MRELERSHAVLAIASARACVVRTQGFDEYMNLVIDNAEEVGVKKGTRKPLGASSLAARPRERVTRGAAPTYARARAAPAVLRALAPPGRILLKGDAITLITAAPEAVAV